MLFQRAPEAQAVLTNEPPPAAAPGDAVLPQLEPAAQANEISQEVCQLLPLPRVLSPLSYIQYIISAGLLFNPYVYPIYFTSYANFRFVRSASNVCPLGFAGCL